MRVVSTLTKGRNWNTQYTGGPFSTLRRSLPFGFLRLSLFGHVIAPDVIQPSFRVQPTDKGGHMILTWRRLSLRSPGWCDIRQTSLTDAEQTHTA
jgi:hypothetical protein